MPKRRSKKDEATDGEADAAVAENDENEDAEAGVRIKRAKSAVKKTTKGRKKKDDDEAMGEAAAPGDGDDEEADAPAGIPLKKAKSKSASMLADEEELKDRPRNTTMPDVFDFRTLQHGEIKISSWNVASINASVKKGFRKYADAEDATILCLQETKLSNQPLPGAYVPLDVYPHQHFATATSRKGYAGVAILSKLAPISIIRGWAPPLTPLPADEEEVEDDGRSLTIELEHLYVVCTYVPNSGAGLKTLPHRLRFDERMRGHLEALRARKPVVWCGDLNCAAAEIDLMRPKQNLRSAGFTVEERESFAKTKETQGLVDVWREKNPGVKRFSYFRFQCRSKYLGWRLDYVLVSKELVEKVVEAEIRDVAYGASDHVPVMLTLKV